MRIQAAVAALVITLLSGNARAEEPELTWVSNGSPDDVQFGEAETDYRLLRLRCLSPGRIEMSGPLPGDEKEKVSEGKRVKVQVKVLGESRQVDAKVEERGDGWNFVATITPAHEAVVNLIGNNPVGIFRGKSGYTVPGKGAGSIVKAMTASCK